MIRFCNLKFSIRVIVGFTQMVLLGFGGIALATPSTTYWTPCTIDIQPAGVTHLGIDDYFSAGSTETGAQFPTDLGLTFGANLPGKMAAEFGIDLLLPGSNPLFFNAKFGYREGVLSKDAPAIQLGFFNFGTRNDVTNQNIAYLTIGKSLPGGRTRLAASYYLGNDKVLVSGAGDNENQGFMVAIDHALVPGKVVLAGDYASGDNAIGGGGVGAYYYFTKDISLLAGLVWFNDKSLNGPTKITVQLDVNF